MSNVPIIYKKKKKCKTFFFLIFRGDEINYVNKYGGKINFLNDVVRYYFFINLIQE